MSQRQSVARYIAFALEDVEDSSGPLVVSAESRYNPEENVAYVDVVLPDGEQLEIVVDAP